MLGVHTLAWRKLARIAAMACAVILLSLLVATTGPAAAGDDAQRGGPARLDSHLAQLAEAFEENGIEGAQVTGFASRVHLTANSLEG